MSEVMSSNEPTMREILPRFARYYRPHLKLFILDLFCALGVAALELVFPVVTRRMLNQVIPARDISMLLWLVALMVGLYLMVAVLQYIINYWGHVVGIRMEADMRRDVFSHLQRLSFRFYDNNRTGRLMSRVVNDLNEITELAHHGPEDLFLSAVMMLGSLAVLFTIEWRLALALLIFIPLMTWFTVTQRGAMQTAFRSVREKIADVNAQLENSISGNRVVQAFTNEEYEIGKFNESNTRFKHAKYYAYSRMSRFMTGLNFLTNILNVAVVGYGGYLIYRGFISTGDLVAFVLYIGLILQPIRRLANFTQQFEQGMSGFRRFAQIMDETPDIRDSEHAIDLTHVQGRIEFRDVTFSYDTKDEEGHVLRHISLAVPPGKTVALVGPSGAGKTTMCNLIPRFYDVREGAILIDGTDVRSVRISSLRRAIGIVQQDVFLFTGTVRENILYGDVGATDAQIEQAARRANIHDFILTLPNGYESEIGEKGIRLSGGQKQRLAIARAFLKNPPILLLDEATASLDNETEARIQAALRELSAGRTTLVIAHRLSTIKNADEIVVLTEEGIAERGNHDRLMAAGGLYRELYNAQFAGYGVVGE
jgi:ATP-binding cassette subfamily B protein